MKHKKKRLNVYDVKKIFKSRTDVAGSYTGTGEKDELPVQDADDL